MNEPSADWARHQRDFRHHFSGDRDSLVPTAVHWRATPATTVATRDGFGAILADGLLTRAAQSIARLRKRGPRVVHVPYLSIWPAGAPAGTPTTLTFDIAEPPSFSYEGDGELFGACTAGATLVVVTTDGELIWPVSTPRHPAPEPSTIPA